MSVSELAIGVLLGLAVNEMFEVSPWLARRAVRLAARLWSADPEVAAGYAEEWTAVVTERPGKLFKLITALWFVAGGALRAFPRVCSRATAAVRSRLSRRRQRTLSRVTYIKIMMWLGFSGGTLAVWALARENDSALAMGATALMAVTMTVIFWDTLRLMRNARARRR